MSILSLHTNHGLPICLSSITHREMADHDRRREAMKKQRRAKRGLFGADQEMGSQVISQGSVTEEEIKEIDGDLARVLRDLSTLLSFSCIAKAA